MSKEEEFEKMLKNKPLIDSLIDEMFMKSDLNQSGFVEYTELYFAMTEMAKELNKTAPTKEKVAEIMDKLDLNKDGKLSKEEYKPFVLKLLKKLYLEGALD